MLEKQARLIEKNRVAASTEICTKVNGVTRALQDIITEASHPDVGDTPEDLKEKETFNLFAQKELSTLRCDELVQPTPLPKD